MERLVSSPAKLIMIGNQPLNGMDSLLTAHTFNSSFSSTISDRGRMTKSGRYLSFQSRLVMLTRASVSSKAFTAKLFRLHCMRAFLPISLATAPHLVWSDTTQDGGSGSPRWLAASDITDKGDSVLLLLRQNWVLLLSVHSLGLLAEMPHENKQNFKYKQNNILNNNKILIVVDPFLGGTTHLPPATSPSVSCFLLRKLLLWSLTIRRCSCKIDGTVRISHHLWWLC